MVSLEPTAKRQKATYSPHVLSIAPMIQWTDRHWRYFMRQITRKTLLYTEMTMDTALTYNPDKLERFIGHLPDVEYPLAIQLGGCDPVKLGEAAYLCESFGAFSEINLNSGCPSNKAKKAGFGAELMLEPDLVRRIVHEMKRRVTHTEVTVKCRIGVTDRESYDDLLEYINAVKSGGVNHMIIHARSCVLKGLSPAQNRTVPPLHPEVVHKLVAAYPDMTFVLNGGVETYDQVDMHLGRGNSVSSSGSSSGSGSSSSSTACASDELRQLYVANPVHGVMVGREAYRNPWMFAQADRRYYGDSTPIGTRREIIEKYLDYAQDAATKGLFGSNCCSIIKPLHNAFHGCDANTLYKRKLDDLLKKHSVNVDKQHDMTVADIVHMAMEDTIPDSFLDEPVPT